jgi:hypothetical protein
MNPSDNAVNFEAVKVSMSQNKDGVMLKLSIHPNDCPPSLHADWVGSRYIVALVRLNDDDTVVEDKEKAAGRKAVAIAGSMCRNPKFRDWLHDNGISSGIGEDPAIEGLKRHLAISSRSELATDLEARRRFMDLVGAFEIDMRGGSI